MILDVTFTADLLEQMCEVGRFANSRSPLAIRSAHPSNAAHTTLCLSKQSMNVTFEKIEAIDFSTARAALPWHAESTTRGPSGFANLRFR
jgi:hypothetical protein